MDIKERLDELIKCVQELGDKALNILITHFDPDAVAAALGLAYIVKKLRNNSEAEELIFYCGEIGRQNSCIFSKYDLKRKIRPISEFDPKTGVIALVDSSNVEDGRLPQEIRPIKPVIVIDHHRGEPLDKKKSTFIWIEDIGSCSTMIAELLQAIEGTDEHLSGEDGRMLATTLALGIYTDTKKLVSGASRDRSAYGYVTQFVSPVEISQLIDYPLPESYFDNLTSALNNFTRKGSRIIANTGFISASEGNDLSTIADFLLRMEGITLVVAWGIIEKTVRISTRSRGLPMPFDEFLKDRFGSNSGAKITPDGRVEGGAIIELSLPVGAWWRTEATEESIEEVVTKRLKEVVFADQSKSIGAAETTDRTTKKEQSD